MGRLKLSKTILIYTIGIVLGTGVGFTIYKKLAHTSTPSPAQLNAYLQNNALVVAVDDTGNFQQIYYVYDGLKQYITDGAVNHFSPKASGHYVAWLETPEGNNQQLLYLYDILTRTKLQLTFYDTIGGFELSNDHVVWVSNGTTPQIMLYDGHLTQQISKDYPSLRPAISENKVAYAQKLNDKLWAILEYDVGSMQSTTVFTGLDDHAAWPRFENGQIVTKGPY